MPLSPDAARRGRADASAKKRTQCGAENVEVALDRYVRVKSLRLNGHVPPGDNEGAEAYPHSCCPVGNRDPLQFAFE
jgi:hypothetical protein